MNEPAGDVWDDHFLWPRWIAVIATAVFMISGCSHASIDGDFRLYHGFGLGDIWLAGFLCFFARPVAVLVFAGLCDCLFRNEKLTKTMAVVSVLFVFSLIVYWVASSNETHINSEAFSVRTGYSEKEVRFDDVKRIKVFLSGLVGGVGAPTMSSNLV
jgi:hypothetical protein